jgi:hypothetical protein
LPPQRHPNKEVRKALAFAEDKGWEIEPRRGHAWGVMRCGGGCKVSIWSTPRDPDVHAEQLIRAVAKCPHRHDENDASDETDA